jgi:arabinan endo-1,5-alpha-L-arabinosidase
MRRLSFAAVAIAAAQPSGCRNPRSEANDLAGQPYVLKGDVCAVHDPAIAVEGGRQYIFSTDTGFQGSYRGSLIIRCGDAANVTFTLCGEIFPSGLTAIPWTKQYAPTATNVWAPDVSYWGGLWHVYYAVSEFGKPISVIGLATSPTLDPTGPAYAWTDAGPVVSSNGTEGWNAIDPSVIISGGVPFMVLGSFWSGIQLLRLDAGSGRVDPSFPVTALARREGSNTALEGSFLVQRGDTYYLFVSWNACCQGALSTYEVRVGRSIGSVSGPYLDEAGVGMLQGGGTHLLGANGTPGTAGNGWAAAGGESILRETLAGPKTAMIVHAYDGVSGDPWAMLVGLEWGTGWPTVAAWP